MYRFIKTIDFWSKFFDSEKIAVLILYINENLQMFQEQFQNTNRQEVKYNYYIIFYPKKKCGCDIDATVRYVGGQWQYSIGL